MDRGKLIIEALDADPEVYQREGVQAAMEFRDDAVPALLDCLERVLSAPEEFAYPASDSMLPIYAVYLLSHHRVVEAHPLIVRLAGLPGEMPFDLFGDAVHEGIPLALWKTSGGDPTQIKALISNKQANEYCRSAAIRALMHGVADDGLERDEVVGFLQGLFTAEESTREHPMVWNGAASALADMWPGESMDVLRKAFDDHLIDPGFIDLSFIEQRRDDGFEPRMEAFRAWRLKELGETPHEALSHWACFNRDATNDGAAAFIGARRAEEKATKRKKRNRTNKKKKQARAARKKGRGKKKRKR